MTKSTNLDILLYLAAKDSAEKEVEEFLALDASEFAVTPELRRRAYKLIKKSKKQPMNLWRAVKYVAVACLICMSLCFAACICIPQVRRAMKEAFVDWYEDYIAIGFSEQGEYDEPAAPTDTVEEGGTSSDVSDGSDTAADGKNVASHAVMSNNELPITIEKRAYATYLPDGYVEDVKLDNLRYYVLSYTDGDILFTLKQSTITDYLLWVNSNDKNVTKEKINGFVAILTKDESDPHEFLLVWQDDEYEFYLSGAFESKEELIKIAEGIKTK